MNWKPLIIGLIVLAAVAYVLWPVDILPDFIPIIGWIDDFIAGAIGVWALLKGIL
jgi:uncharacterized membrane protein YkvA (DUF1232 family)